MRKEIMADFLDRLRKLQNGKSVSEFARFLGMNQKSLDNYTKGERKPSTNFIITICTKCSVSADWLLGLTEKQTSPTEPAKPCVECLKKDETITNLSQALRNVTATKKATPSHLLHGKP